MTYEKGDQLKLSIEFFKEYTGEIVSDARTFRYIFLGNMPNSNFIKVKLKSGRVASFKSSWFELVKTEPLTEFEMLDNIKLNIEQDL